MWYYLARQFTENFMMSRFVEEVYGTMQSSGTSSDCPRL